jgi:hypothetical protein
MKIKTSELQGAALDWAVAKCEGYTGLHKIEGRMPHEPQLGIWPPRKEYGVMDLWELGFSTDWSQGGPIIERHWIELVPWPNESDENDRWEAIQNDLPIRVYHQGSTPLIAAMRCYVASNMGDEVEVPDELLEEV